MTHPPVILASHLSGEQHFRSAQHMVVPIPCHGPLDYHKGVAAWWETSRTIINVEQLNAFDDGATVTPETLVEAGLADKRFWEGVKVLGNGELKKKLTVKAHRFSVSAREKITKAGGLCEELPLRSIHHKPAEPAATAKTAAGEK